MYRVTLKIEFFISKNGRDTTAFSAKISRSQTVRRALCSASGDSERVFSKENLNITKLSCIGYSSENYAVNEKFVFFTFFNMSAHGDSV